MSFFSDDDVVVYRDPQGLCDFHNDLVISISAREGVGSPEGRLWTRMMMTVP